MPAGLQVFNTDNILQIDGQFANYFLTDRGRSSSDIRVYYPDTGDATNLVFVRPLSYGTLTASYGAYAGGVFPNIGVFPQGCYFQARLNNQNVGQSLQFDYVVAQRTSAFPGAGNSGLQVFGDAGQLVYDSNRNYLTIATVGVATYGGPSQSLSPPVTYNLPAPPAGKKYYHLLNPLSVHTAEYQRGIEGFQEEWLYAAMVHWSSETQFTISPYRLAEYQQETAGGITQKANIGTQIIVMVIAA